MIASKRHPGGTITHRDLPGTRSYHSIVEAASWGSFLACKKYADDARCSRVHSRARVGCFTRRIPLFFGLGATGSTRASRSCFGTKAYEACRHTRETTANRCAAVAFAHVWVGLTSMFLSNPLSSRAIAVNLLFQGRQRKKMKTRLNQPLRAERSPAAERAQRADPSVIENTEHSRVASRVITACL